MKTCSSYGTRDNLCFSAFNQNGLSGDMQRNITGFMNKIFSTGENRVKNPRQIANYMTPKLESVLMKSENRKGGYGIVALDFPSATLISQLVHSNLRSELLK